MKAQRDALGRLPSKEAELAADAGYVPLKQGEVERATNLLCLPRLLYPSEVLEIAIARTLLLPEDVDGYYRNPHSTFRPLCPASSTAVHFHEQRLPPKLRDDCALLSSKVQCAIMKSLGCWIARRYLGSAHVLYTMPEPLRVWLVKPTALRLWRPGDSVGENDLNTRAVQAWRLHWARKLVDDWRSMGQ